MLEILHAERMRLLARVAELHDLIAAAEQRGEEVAASANAEIARLKSEAEQHAAELTGVRHTLAHLAGMQAQAEATPPAPTPSEVS